ncbi:MAG: J domain-containing protein [Sphingomonadales bacterium]|nr:J domain-containing protein [Sphingomonadales bacterium]
MASRPHYDRFHGRVHDSERTCDHPGCIEPGEFRAPGTRHRRGGFDGPGEYSWLCLDHVREFNRKAVRTARRDGKPLSGRDRENLQILGLDANADRKLLRKRYAELLRTYHPDRNGGDRSHEQRLLRVIDAYTELKRAPAFA